MLFLAIGRHPHHLPGNSSVPSPLRVVIVDDNKDFAITECRLLEVHGYECEVAGTVADGLEAIMQFNPDAVLFDLKMPGDGFRLPELLRQLPGPMPVLIAISGLVDSSTTERLRSLGVEHHLAKPVPPEKLLDLLASIERSRN
jgi:CheY-like chemotaxis protein